MNTDMRMKRSGITRRRFMQAGIVGVSGVALAGCKLTPTIRSRSFGVSTEYEPLRRVLVHAPSPAVGSLPTPEALRKYNFDAQLDYPRALVEHQRFVELLGRHGADVIEVRDLLAGDPASQALIDSDPNFMFMRDIMTMAPRGALLLRMGLDARRPEVGVVERAIRKLGIPIVGRFTAPATVEGGSLMWLDPGTLIVGLCNRTNGAAVAQLRGMSRDAGIRDIIAVSIPGHVHIDGILAVPGPETVFARADRLQDSMATVYTASGARDVRFLDELTERGHEVSSFGRLCNTVYTAPFVGIAVEANVDAGIPPHLQRFGGRLDTFVGDELIKGNGGAHCLTCPLLRTVS